jgi:hypothetical protein
MIPSAAFLWMSALRLVEKMVAVVSPRAPVVAGIAAIPSFQSTATRHFLVAPPLQPQRIAMNPGNCPIRGS